MAHLELHDLCFSVPSVDILQSVNLTVGEGKCVALLGPSGCGKTTTLRCIAGFIQPTGGDITFNQETVLGLPAYKRNVGLVFQDYALFPHMTVAENIAYGLERRGVPSIERKARVAEVMSMVQLESFANRLPRQMSGGQQQRVSLARALVVRPNVLLLDEPLGALDRKLRDQMQVELKRIQRETGTTTIIVTHDQEEALSLSDHVAVMLNGQIAEFGTPTELYSRPESRAVMEFLGASNIIAAKVSRVEAMESLLQLPSGSELRVPGKQAEGSFVEIGIRPEHIRVVREEPKSSSNVITGTISEAVYKGPHAELYISNSGMDDIIVHHRILGVSKADTFSIGEQVFLYIDSDAVVVFK